MKDYKDWYAYARKLEDAVSLLNQRIKFVEDENVELKEVLDKHKHNLEQLH